MTSSPATGTSAKSTGTPTKRQKVDGDPSAHTPTTPNKHGKSSSNGKASRSEQEYNLAILDYLKKMGYRQSEQQFQSEAGLEELLFEAHTGQDAFVRNYWIGGSGSAAGGGGSASVMLSMYDRAYTSLRTWIEGSLDAFRDELWSLLWPLFVHCYLDLHAKGHGEAAKEFMDKHKEAHSSPSTTNGATNHATEITRLQAIKDASHIKDCPVSSAYRSSACKYRVTMSKYAFELVMGFLREQAGECAGSVLLLKIVNQFVDVRIRLNNAGGAAVEGLFVRGDGRAAAGPMEGVGAAAGARSASTPVHWGVHPLDPALEAALQKRSKSESRLFELLQGPLAALKRSHSQSIPHAPPSSALSPAPPPSHLETNAAIDRLRSLAHKATISVNTPPSICQYTVHNTWNGISAVVVGGDGRWLATGNQHSFIDCWSLDQQPLRAIRPSTELTSIDLSSLSPTTSPGVGGINSSSSSNHDALESAREYNQDCQVKRLIGHSGPVYGLSFFATSTSPGHRMMASCSQDGSVRVWSLDLFSCLLVWRDHLGPVWCIECAPLGTGPYLVSGGADGTARLYSTHHPSALRIFAGHLSDITAITWHPNTAYIFTGSTDGTIRMWSVQSGQCVRVYCGHDCGGVGAIACSPDGRFMVSGDRAGVVRLWDVAEGTLVKAIDLRDHVDGDTNKKDDGGAGGRGGAHASPRHHIHSIKYDRDGRIIAIGDDKGIHLYEVAKLLDHTLAAKQALMGRFETKDTPVRSLYFTFRNLLLSVGPFMPPVEGSTCAL